MDNFEELLSQKETDKRGAWWEDWETPAFISSLKNYLCEAQKRNLDATVKKKISEWQMLPSKGTAFVCCDINKQTWGIWKIHQHFAASEQMSPPLRLGPLSSNGWNPVPTTQRHQLKTSKQIKEKRSTKLEMVIMMFNFKTLPRMVTAATFKAALMMNPIFWLIKTCHIPHVAPALSAITGLPF